jgi:glycosyltransferase involved in cell wall biosynthesis
MRIFIMTRGYPAAERLYNHAFVHRRVLAYRAAGHCVSVFWIKPRGETAVYRFEGVDVVVGGPDACLAQIAAFMPDAVAAHAMADDFWPVLSRLSPELPICAWIYGSEILPFHSVTENPAHDSLRADKAAGVHRRRIAFWQAMAQDWPANLLLVFVSSYAAFAAEQAIGKAIPRKVVQPTGVDTELFGYVGKPPHQRFHVLSIRPFSDWRYANDQSVAAILSLRDHPLFETFRFRFVGEGHLFDAVLAPVRHLPNVTCERRFLRQAEISAMHKEHGISLCPSRDDAQGVSRDEAMSSGLVPIASHVGAVPEFVDETCGMLVPPENPAALATAIARLGECATTFADLSRAAAKRARDSIGMSRVIQRECEILKHGRSPL